MKAGIVAESQEEFDAKRPELIKAIAGERFSVDIRPKGEKLATEAREPVFKAQKEMLAYWDGKFQEMLSDLKRQVSEIIEE